MFQYLRPRRPTTSSTTTTTSECDIPFFSPSNDQPRNDSSNVDLNNSTHIGSSAILIFPNPPSERESSRSAPESRCDFSGSSTLSLPTDVSYTIDSVRSTSRSRSRGERARVHGGGNESWQSVLDEFLPEEQEQSEWELESAYLRQECPRFTHYPTPRARHAGTSSTSSSSGLSSPSLLPFSLSPQPPFRLPFLSFLQSFLTLDESTLHLISRSPDPQVSSLFPVSPGPHLSTNTVDNDVVVGVEDGEDQPPHGALKLFLSNPDKSQSTALLKEGIDPSGISGDANPFLMSPTRIPVWQALEFVIEGGVRVWKEVTAWEAGDMRLMGV